MTGAYAAYQILGWIALALGWPVLAGKALRDARYRVGWGERLGRWPARRNGQPLWVHGASVGEMRAAAPLVAALRARGVPLLLTTTSPSGREAAGGLAGEGGSARLLPLDLAPLVRRALRRTRPLGLVVVETELWPALLLEAKRAGVPALLVNARVSDHTYPRYRRFRRWLGPLLGTFASVQAQSEEDARRFVELGAPAARVCLGGNLKFDVPAPDTADPEVAALRRARAGGWRILVGGSTHPGEEEALLEAVRLLEERGLRPGLVLAPRHLERLGEVEAAAGRAGRVLRRWSELGDPLEAGILAALGRGEVLAVDRYGLLGRLYGAAEAAFVGGSLTRVGGHNLLEPLSWGVPALFGPHMNNARDVRDEVVARQLGREVSDARELADAAGAYLVDAVLAGQVRAGAQRLFESNRGAAARAVGALEGMGVLARSGGP